MKRVIVVCFIVCLLVAGSGFAESKYMFGIKPGNTLSSAYFGIRTGRLVPMVGTDLVWLSASATETDEDYHSYGTSSYRSIDQNKLEGSAFLLIPHLGAKMYMGDRDIRPYLFGSVFFSIPLVNAESEERYEYWEYENGELTEHHVDTSNEDLNKEDENLIKDALGFWGFSFGFGTEYFLSDSFSIGGEYGIRLLLDGIGRKETHGDHEDGEILKDEASAKVGLTYAVVTLNYHF
ncbi:MAG: hypothetical protein V1694_00775 [Candidatus Eisenbacteria bacterium]